MISRDAEMERHAQALLEAADERLKLYAKMTAAALRREPAILSDLESLFELETLIRRLMLKGPPEYPERCSWPDFSLPIASTQKDEIHRKVLQKVLTDFKAEYGFNRKVSPFVRMQRRILRVVNTVGFLTGKELRQLDIAIPYDPEEPSKRGRLQTMVSKWRTAFDEADWQRGEDYLARARGGSED